MTYTQLISRYALRNDEKDILRIDELAYVSAQHYCNYQCPLKPYCCCGNGGHTTNIYDSRIYPCPDNFCSTAVEAAWYRIRMLDKVYVLRDKELGSQIFTNYVHR